MVQESGFSPSLRQNDADHKLRRLSDTHSTLSAGFFNSSESATLNNSSVTSQAATNAGLMLNVTVSHHSHPEAPIPHSGRTPTDRRPQQSEEPSVLVNGGVQNLRTRAQVYFDSLLPEGRGSPLYTPSPDLCLPKEYRKVGVRPGDVVIINNDGGISYLFNIFAAPDDPINYGRVPASFKPFPKEKIQLESYPYRANVVMSSSVQSSSSGLAFETSREGALVALPFGATSPRLVNTKFFDKYIKRYCESWYHLALSQGRPVENGDIRLVIGCDKTTTWGLATFLSLEKTNGQVIFKAIGGNQVAGRTEYTHQCSGSAAAQTGPMAVEIEDLQEPGSVSPIENQCIFLRTTNPSLSDEVLNGILQRVEAEYFDDWDVEPDAAQKTAPKNTPKGSPSWLGVLSGFSSKASINHPSSRLNQLLLKKFPGAKLVITDDEHWASVLVKDEPFPCAEEIFERLQRSYMISEENSVVTVTQPSVSRPRMPRTALYPSEYSDLDMTTMGASKADSGMPTHFKDEGYWEPSHSLQFHSLEQSTDDQDMKPFTPTTDDDGLKNTTWTPNTNRTDLDQDSGMSDSSIYPIYGDHAEYERGNMNMDSRDNVILQLQDRIQHLEQELRDSKAALTTLQSTAIPTPSTHSPNHRESRTQARKQLLCSLNRAGNALCAWHNSQRERRAYPPRSAPPGFLTCGCTYEQALFEESLSRHGVGSQLPGDTVRMNPALRNPLLKLLEERYGYRDGDFEFDPVVQRWAEGEEPDVWEQRAKSGSIAK